LGNGTRIGVVADAENIIRKNRMKKIIKHKDYIIKYGADPEEITNWQWQKNF